MILKTGVTMSDMTLTEWEQMAPLEKIKAHMERHGCDNCRYTCGTECLKGLKTDLDKLPVWKTLDCSGWKQDTVDEDFIERTVRQYLEESCENLRANLHRQMYTEEILEHQGV